MRKQPNNAWIDVSQPLHDKLAHWPGDTPFSYQVTYSEEQTGSVNIGQMTMSVHSGTHVDAPFHFRNDGAKILDLDINVFIGEARVIELSSFEKIDKAALSTIDLDGVTRLLIKTAIPNRPDRFPESIPYVTADGACYLHEKGIRLIGVDVPSVDALDSKELEGHHALFQHQIHILENLMLDHVKEGDYELIALPLPLKDADGSPVRAVIRPL
ncbi:arylformamidase [Halalkalibacter okhensis]|uniref:Kynurenine formamidase n=1 Tax=Halalkalibacter okhensis TaxID=333138 RepID=A0A0B0IL55_9BACI|nr:arylformamidase [Halalkalibacter okhensis]KHF41632.1 kynurenine formamidase [Halalkalibacter okhensis]